MFKNEYQGGPYFEVLSPQGKDSLANWKTPSNGFKKVFEKEAKSYVFYIEGTPATTKISSPKDPKHSLTLIQRYLILQIFVGKGQDFLIELGVSDLANNKRRLFLSTTQKETQVAAALHARVPLTIMKRHKWLNLCIDMVSMVGEIWRGQTYKAIESITVSANCKVRRIFTMKCQPPDNADDEELYECPPSNSGEIDQIPKQFQLTSDVDQVTQLLNITKIRHAERLKSGGDVSRSSALELDLSASGRKSSIGDTRYRIAFGTKVPISGSQNSARKAKEQGNTTSRGTRASHSRADGTHSRVEDGYGGDTDLSASVASKDGLVYGAEASNQVSSTGSTRSDHNKSVLHQRQHSDPLSREELEMYSRIEYDHHDHIQPHPPREPSSDRLRRRIRVKNGPGSSNKDRGSSAGSLKDENQNNSSHTKSPPEASRVLSHLSLSRQRRTSSESESLSSPNDSGIESKPTISSKAEEIYTRKSGEYNVRNYQGVGAADMDESVSDLIAVLNKKSVLEDDSEGLSSSGAEGAEEYESSTSDADDKKEMFLFVSKPKSAPRRHLSPNNLADNDLDLSKNSVSSTKGHRRGTKSRGPKPEDDFHNGNQSSSDDDDNKMRKKLPGSRPNSGSNSRPHSGTSLGRPSSNTSLGRPGSGTSGGKPQSGTVRNRPNSAGASPKTSQDRRTSKSESKHKNNSEVSSKSSADRKNNKNPTIVVPKLSVDTKIDLRPLHNGPKKASGSPELSSSQMHDPSLDVTLTNRSISRMNRKSLREISQSDVTRKSEAKSSEKPYDFKKYQIAEITDSFEARMFASMKRQNEDDMEDYVPSPRKETVNSPRKPNPFNTGLGASLTTPFQGDGAMSNGVICDFSPHATSDEDSTWQAPPNNPHNFQDEMKGRLSTDTMSSNPRDWSGVFSPPIMLPHELANSTEDFSLSSTSPIKDPTTARTQDTDNDEEELDLVYDPCLNCYYDPRSCKYYELI